MESANGVKDVEAPVPTMTSFATSTRALHADDFLNQTSDVAPPMHVSTTFRYIDDPSKLVPMTEIESMLKPGTTVADCHIYSRESGPNTSRLEAVLSAVTNGSAITYTSGLAAYHALMCYFNPKVVAIGAGYHGCHGVLKLHKKLTGAKQVDLHDERTWDEAGLGKGDLVHVETPLNPTGEASNLEEIAKKAHARGALVSVDATFGPPSLQDPFKQGADIVMHSGTKYIGGHSDMLCGVLVVPSHRRDWWVGLFTERLYLGSVMGSLEGWLGMRSIRTMELRVQRQSQTAEALVRWLDEALNGNSAESEVVKAVVSRIQHASLQKDDMHWLKKQMPNGFGPVFAIWMKTPDLAKTLPSKLHLFQHATSLGGVESLIEWRRMSDDTVDERLLRVSVGIEAVEDLTADLLSAFKALQG